MTSIPTELAALFEALGPQTDAIDMVLVDDENEVWTVVLDDEVVVLFEWNEELERLVVMSRLGRPAEHAMIKVYQAALAYNASWHLHGGARVGMVDTDGELAMMIDLPTQGLALEQLQRALLGMRTVAIAWTRILADPADSAAVAALPAGMLLA